MVLFHHHIFADNNLIGCTNKKGFKIWGCAGPKNQSAQNLMLVLLYLPTFHTMILHASEHNLCKICSGQRRR